MAGAPSGFGGGDPLAGRPAHHLRGGGPDPDRAVAGPEPVQREGRRPASGRLPQVREHAGARLGRAGTGGVCRAGHLLLQGAPPRLRRLGPVLRGAPPRGGPDRVGADRRRPRCGDQQRGNAPPAGAQGRAPAGAWLGAPRGAPLPGGPVLFVVGAPRAAAAARQPQAAVPELRLQPSAERRAAGPHARPREEPLAPARLPGEDAALCVGGAGDVRHRKHG
mmetsp:Transcript_103634/g.270658  ORF Transcript_103634/g.270658 Transcript_103634/m.270658 type:complete len:221 (-) Transcript_103634:627-1289(-)